MPIQDLFWSVKENTNKGSWMWKELLKYRDLAKFFHKVDLRNGENTSFWLDIWSLLGRISDITGLRGYIDLGIQANETVEMVLNSHRQRRHRVDNLNQIEDEVNRERRDIQEGDDVVIWRAHVINTRTNSQQKTLGNKFA